MHFNLSFFLSRNKMDVQVANLCQFVRLAQSFKIYFKWFFFLSFFSELMAAQTEHRKKMSKFYAAQEGDIDIGDTEIGRVRIKLSRLMAKKMSGNPAFRRSVQQMHNLLTQQGGELKLAQKMCEKLEIGVYQHSDKVQNMQRRESDISKITSTTEKIKTWKPLNT